LTGNVTGDLSGNVTGNLIGNVTGNISGTANSANAWTTARNIALSGDISGNAFVDGTQNVTINTSIQPNSVQLGTHTTGDYLANIVSGTGITITDNLGEGMTPVISVTPNIYDEYGAASSAEANAVSYANTLANTAYSNSVSYVDSRTINNLSDVNIANVASGDFLRYNGISWINDPVNLATDTVGDYLANISAGTGILISNSGGEGSNPIISIDSEFTLTANGDVDGSVLISNLANATLTLTIANGSVTSDKIDFGFVETLVAGNNIEIIGEIGVGALSPEISVSDDPSFNTVTAQHLFVDGIEIDTTGAIFGQVLKFDGVKFIPDEDTAEEGLGTVSKYSATIGDGTNTTFTVTHGLGTRDVIVEIYETDYYETVYAAVKRVNLNSIEVTFSTPPSSSSRRVVVTG